MNSYDGSKGGISSYNPNGDILYNASSVLILDDMPPPIVNICNPSYNN